MYTKRLFLLLFFSLSGLYSFDLDPVGKEVKEGVKNYKTRKYQEALDNFERAEREDKSEKKTSFNKGATQYKLGDYDQALKSFEEGANASDKATRAKSYFNMGNTYYKKGDNLSAIRSYLKSLEVDPNFVPAQKNLELLRRKEEQKKQMQQQQQNSNQEQEQQNKEQNSQNKEDDNKKDSPKNQQQPQNAKNSGEDQKKDQQSNPDKLTKEDAERILESTRQDQVKRKKTNLSRKNNNGVFW